MEKGKNEMQHVKVSVVTVCRNVASALEKTMESVFVQTYDNMEYIVIDGASTDNSLNLIKRNSNRIHYWVSEPDKGIYDAMNKAIKVATGEWIIFLNAGDVFAAPDVVERVFAIDHSSSDVVYGDCLKEIDHRLVVIHPHAHRNSHRMNFSHQCVFTRTSWLKKTPFDTKYKLSADFKSFKQIGLEKGVFEYVPIAVSQFDTNGVSNTRRADGLRENIRIIWEMDTWTERMRLLPRIGFTYLMCRLRGNRRSGKN